VLISMCSIHAGYYLDLKDNAKLEALNRLADCPPGLPEVFEKTDIITYLAEDARLPITKELD